MERTIRIIQNHRYDKTKKILYKGISKAIVGSDYYQINYTEMDGTSVTLKFFETHVEINREGEVRSNLLFITNKVTRNQIHNEYGVIEIEVYTYAYNKNHDKIIVEYDILSSEELGYVLEVQVEEGFSEFN